LAERRKSDFRLEISAILRDVRFSWQWRFRSRSGFWCHVVFW